MGLPAVVVVTDQFDKLAKVIMKAQRVPESIMIQIKGNPEFFSQDELMGVADNVLEEAIKRLTEFHTS